ncbi:conserved hypothetical protein, membrane [Candidatus Magnetomorum sp. HK-1]|nr:conserved hypothetical protein, membrane [Candidatus Magnetomorum sp. HK-1]
MKINFILIFFILISSTAPFVYAEESINERLVRVEESIKNLSQQMDLLRQNINRRFDDERVFNYFILGGIFTLLTLIGTLIVIILWDRRSSLKPVQQ